MSRSLQLKKYQNKIRFETEKLRENLMLIFGMYNQNLIVFDGGLGSQILSYYQFQYLLTQGIRPYVNLEYYTRENKDFDSNLEFRKWSLDRYGITLQSFYREAIITDSYAKVPTNLLSKKHANYFAKLQSLDLRDTLQINDDAVNKFLKLHEVFSEYYAIHIRRGDYLTAASLLVDDEDIINLIGRLFPNYVKVPVLLFSDSLINPRIVDKLKECGYSKIMFCGPDTADQFMTHDLMRNAKILITSNSTFSLSAGLLARENQTAIVPMKFYSGYRDAPANALINEMSNFSIMNRNR